MTTTLARRRYLPEPTDAVKALGVDAISWKPNADRKTLFQQLTFVFFDRGQVFQTLTAQGELDTLPQMAAMERVLTGSLGTCVFVEPNDPEQLQHLLHQYRDHSGIYALATAASSIPSQASQASSEALHSLPEATTNLLRRHGIGFVTENEIGMAILHATVDPYFTSLRGVPDRLDGDGGEEMLREANGEPMEYRKDEIHDITVEASSAVAAVPMSDLRDPLLSTSRATYKNTGDTTIQHPPSQLMSRGGARPDDDHLPAPKTIDVQKQVKPSRTRISYMTRPNVAVPTTVTATTTTSAAAATTTITATSNFKRFKKVCAEWNGVWSGPSMRAHPDSNRTREKTRLCPRSWAWIECK